MRVQQDGGPEIGRRAAVAGGCLAALGCVVGCGASAPSAPATPIPTGGLAPPSGIGAGGAGTALGPASEVPVGGGRIYPQLEVVVTQPTAGTYRGFSAACTHDGCILVTVADGLMDCPCHGSRFRLDGTVAHGPAGTPLPARPVTIVDGTIVLA